MAVTMRIPITRMNVRQPFPLFYHDEISLIDVFNSNPFQFLFDHVKRPRIEEKGEATRTAKQSSDDVDERKQRSHSIEATFTESPSESDNTSKNGESVEKIKTFKHDQDGRIVRINDDETKFEIVLDTRDFLPHEIKLNVTDGVLKVEGVHEEKNENRMSSHAFSRTYSLPSECEEETHKMRSDLSSGGILTITAPKNPKEAKERETSVNIPITFNKN